jgi:hypothetical protein
MTVPPQGDRLVSTWGVLGIHNCQSPPVTCSVR